MVRNNRHHPSVKKSSSILLGITRYVTSVHTKSKKLTVRNPKLSVLLGLSPGRRQKCVDLETKVKAFKGSNLSNLKQVMTNLALIRFLRFHGFFLSVFFDRTICHNSCIWIILWVLYEEKIYPLISHSYVFSQIPFPPRDLLVKLLRLLCFPEFQTFMSFFPKKMSVSISCICTISLHYRFFLQKANFNFIQYSLGNVQLLVFLSCISFLSFGLFILKQQILYVLLLQKNVCLHFLHLYGFPSVQILLAENKFKYSAIFLRDYKTVGNPCIYIVSVLCEILFIFLLNIPEFLQISFIFENYSFLWFQSITRSTTFLAFIWLVSFMDSS